MIITHVIPSISRKSGGTSTYIRNLLNSFPAERMDNNLVCFASNDALEIDRSIHCFFIPLKSKRINGFSLDFIRIFGKLKTQLFHGNGLWMFPTFLMVKYAIKNKIPYIISPHGMLDSWSLKQSKIKKVIALKIFQKKHLLKANCIHVTSLNEAHNVRSMGFKKPIAVIPNGIDLTDFPDYTKKESKTKKLLFLSRIYTGKGLEDLIVAWSQLEYNLKENWKVEIIGNGEDRYIDSLKFLIKKLNQSESIKILDPVYGKDKTMTYQSADLFVLPTYSENFGIVVAEALASKIPVITTKGAPWQDLITYNCGDWIDIGKDPLKQSLEKFLLMPISELQKKGANGRNLIKQRYSMEAIAKDMMAVYNWLINGDAVPSCVILE